MLFGLERLDVAGELFELALFLIAHLVGVAILVLRWCRLCRRFLGALVLFFRGGLKGVLTPVAILCVVAWKILDTSFTMKHQQVVDHLVGEVAVVADHDDTTWEVLQILLEYL